jgi:hypothetical protein
MPKKKGVKQEDEGPKGLQELQLLDWKRQCNIKYSEVINLTCFKANVSPGSKNHF